MIKPVAEVISLIYIASAIWLIEGLLIVANSFSNITNPTIVPTKPKAGQCGTNHGKHWRFFSILYISSLPTISMLLSMASIGFTNTLNSFIDHPCHGLLFYNPFLVKLFAAAILPLLIWSLIMLMKIIVEFGCFANNHQPLYEEIYGERK